MKSVIIPETNFRRYVGGRAALNLFSESGSGDWHPAAIFYGGATSLEPRFLAGKDCEVDTLELLGDSGIYDCSQVLKEMGLKWQGEACYAATHERALADLVLASIRRGGTAAHLEADDLLPLRQEKQRLEDLLARARPKLNADQQRHLSAWMAKHLQK